MPVETELVATSAVPAVLSEAGPARDGRARFREIFCSVATGHGVETGSDPDCRTLLWQLEDEPNPDGSKSQPPAPDASLRWFVVTGALGDCFGDDSLPFTSGIAHLRGLGLDIRTVRVGGRSGSAHNARQLAATIEAADLGPEDPIALLGYSKGAVDILEFLVAFPEQAAQVKAVVSVSGPILGSPLADLGDWAYEHLFSGTFEQRCDPGDRGVVASLVPETRKRWLASHSLPSHVRYLSLAAFTTRDHMAAGLVPTWEILAGTDKRNDGQVLIGDAVIPGSDLLGYANADHWGVALTIESALPHIAARPEPRPFPQGRLLEAIVLYASEALSSP